MENSRMSKLWFRVKHYKRGAVLARLWVWVNLWLRHRSDSCLFCMVVIYIIVRAWCCGSNNAKTVPCLLNFAPTANLLLLFIFPATFCQQGKRVDKSSNNSAARRSSVFITLTTVTVMIVQWVSEKKASWLSAFYFCTSRNIFSERP